MELPIVNISKRQNQWHDDSVWNSIDFEALGLAFTSLTSTTRTNISKLLHGWMNTGVQRAKFDKYSSSSCPRCGQAPEDQDHILRCHSPQATSARYNALVTLRSSVVTKCGSSRTWTVFHERFTSWLVDGESPSSTVSHQQDMTPATRDLLLQALSEQTQIGWSQASRGYLSGKWLLAQHSEFPRAVLQGLKRTWFKSVISSLWRFHTTMWEHRNSILHAATISARAIWESPIDTKIQQLCDIQESFAATDRVLFSTPLQTRLQTSRRSKKHWLILVSRYQLTTKNRRIGDQPLLTHFFQRKQTQATVTSETEAQPQASAPPRTPHSPIDRNPPSLLPPTTPG